MTLVSNYDFIDTSVVIKNLITERLEPLTVMGTENVEIKSIHNSCKTVYCCYQGNNMCNDKFGNI